VASIEWGCDPVNAKALLFTRSGPFRETILGIKIIRARPETLIVIAVER
jgi:hypothetical protein